MRGDRDGIVRLTIERLAGGGDGVAHLDDGRVAFVGGSCPGDVVDASLIEDHGSYVRAVTDAVVTSSADRVPPGCPLSEQCGGCQWRHVSYRVQLQAKRAEVADALQRIGGLDPALVAETSPSPDQEGYRNKAEFVVGSVAGKLRLGFMGPDGLVAVDHCALLPRSHAKAPKAVAGALSYLAKGRDPGIERVELRVSRRTGDVELALWGPPGPFPRQLAAKVLRDAVGATSIVRVLVRGEARRRRVGKVEVLSGKGHWTEELAGYSFAVSAPSFFQVNTPAAETLVELVSAALPPDPYPVVFDVFAGVGTFTLPLADAGSEVSAFESEGSAVRDLRRNLERARLDADVFPGDAARSMPDAGTADALVVDPPRAGLRPEALHAILAAEPRRIVYVSCDPATLARDLALLAEAGFALSSVTPVDLFPHTYHVESVAVLDAAPR